MRQSMGALAIGICLFGPAHIIYYTSLRHASTVVGTVLNTTAPIWVAVFSFAILRERATPRRLSAILLGFAGAYLVSVGFRLPDLGQGETSANLLYLIGTLIESLGGVLATRMIRKSSGITVLALQIVGSMIAFSVATLVLGDFAVRFPANWDWAAFGAIAFLVLLPGLFCWGAWYIVAEKSPLSLMVVTILIQPIFAAMIGYFWTGEPLTTNLLLGTMVIFCALFVASRENRSKVAAEITSA